MPFRNAATRWWGMAAAIVFCGVAWASVGIESKPAGSIGHGTRRQPMPATFMHPPALHDEVQYFSDRFTETDR